MDPHDPFSPAGVPWTSVSPKLAVVWRLGAVLAAVVPVTVALVLARVLERDWIALLAVPFALGLVVRLALAGRQVRAIGYAEREDDLLVRRGLLFRTLVVVPYGRMQFVDVNAGPVDRYFKMATVTLHTASAATDATIPGLLPAEAERLRDRLASRGQAALAGL